MDERKKRATRPPSLKPQVSSLTPIQRTFILSREEKEHTLDRAQLRWPGISARGIRKIKSLIWVVETTNADSRTAEILASKMACSVSTYNEALLVAQQLGLIVVTHEPGKLSTFWIDWPRLEAAKSEASDSEASEIGGLRFQTGGVPAANAPTTGGRNAIGEPAARGLLHVQCNVCKTHECTCHAICKNEADAMAWVEGVEESKGHRDWWGRDQPLSAADLVAPESIERLFEYAAQRGRFQRTELDRLRFEALCLYCVRRGHIPGALLTRCVFGGGAGPLGQVQYIATARDEDAARKRIRERERGDGPAGPVGPAGPAAVIVDDLARGLGLPPELAARPASSSPGGSETRDDKINALREWEAAIKRRCAEARR